MRHHASNPLTYALAMSQRPNDPTPEAQRLRAVLDLSIPEAREGTGRHEYDGQVQDLSPAGVNTGLARLGGTLLDDPHDEAHLSAFEAATRARFDQLQWHRRNPLIHLENLDLAGYDREYASIDERAAAKSAHLALWPEAIDMACQSLDLVPAPVAEALLPAMEGLGLGVPGDDPNAAAALAAHQRLVDHVAQLAENRRPGNSAWIRRSRGLDERERGRGRRRPRRARRTRRRRAHAALGAHGRRLPAPSTRRPHPSRPWPFSSKTTPAPTRSSMPLLR